MYKTFILFAHKCMPMFALSKAQIAFLEVTKKDLEI
jgi:hypothetical protein